MGKIFLQMKNFFRFCFKSAKHSVLATLVLAGVFCSAIYVFASPTSDPQSLFTIGETSDPGCAYGSAYCDVVAPAGYTFSSNNFSGTGNFVTTGLGSFGSLTLTTSPSSGYVLTSDASGHGTWQPTGSFSMVYPGAGIALSTGTGWGTSITNNSANWNTAYGWGNHASAGYYKSGDNPTFGYTNITDETNGYQVDGIRALTVKGASGSENYFIGRSGNFTTTGIDNITIGHDNLAAVTSGAQNIAIGSYNSTVMTSADNNIAIGNYALFSDTTGVWNTAIGTGALQNNINGQYNVALGNLSLERNISGNNNTGIGEYSLYYTTGSNNTALGQGAGNKNSSGANNVFIGYSAGMNQTTNSNLLIIDNRDRSSVANELTKSLIYGVFDASPANQTLAFNAGSVSFGSDTAGGTTNVPGSIKLFSNGDNAYYTTFTAGTQTANATYTLPAAMPSSNKVLQSDSSGVLSWVSAGSSFGTTTQIPFMNAGGTDFSYSNGLTYNDTNKYISLNGLRAIAVNGATGSENLFLGQSGNFTTTGTKNIFSGYQSGLSNTSGSGNIFIGYQSGNVNDVGGYNVAVGYSSLLSNTLGNNNSAFGTSALASNINGGQNAAFGSSAMSQNNSGSNNSAFGAGSLLLNNNGIRNTAIGSSAGAGATGSYNVFLGYMAGYNQTAVSNLLFIDNQNRGSSADDLTKSLIYGVFDASVANQSLTINGALKIGKSDGSGVAYTLPVTDGSASQFLQTNGNGTVSWQTVSVPATLWYQPTVAGSNLMSYSPLAGNLTMTGTDNFFNGAGAGVLNTTGMGNNFLGYRSGYKNTDGSFNNFLGYAAGLSNTTGSNNIFMGNAAGMNNSNGSENNFLGSSAGYNNSSGSYNNFFGASAGLGNSSGSYNNFIGYNAGYVNTGSYNIFIGYKAGSQQDTGSNLLIIDSINRGTKTSELTKSLIYGVFNSAIASQTLAFNAGSVSFGSDTASGATNVPGSIKLFSNGDNAYYTTITAGTQTANATYTLPTAMGSNGQYLQTDTSGNLSWQTVSVPATLWYQPTVAGNNLMSYSPLAGNLTMTGTDNAFIGLNAGHANTSGTNNFLAGSGAGYSNTTGTDMVAIGYQAGYYSKDTTGGVLNNIFIGHQSGYGVDGGDNSGQGNNFFGYQAGLVNQAGSYNNFLGYQAGSSNSGGSYNNFFGRYAGAGNIWGSNNNFFGDQAGISNTGSNNNFFGSMAGLSNTSGGSNTIIGKEGGFRNQTGSNNILIGDSAGYGVASNSYSNNIFLGYNSGFGNTTGGENIFQGYKAGYSNTTGSNNIFLGGSATDSQQVGYNNTTGSNNIFMGYGTGYSNGDANNMILIGYQAGRNITGAVDSTIAIGTQAGYSNKGYNNVLIGFQAGYLNSSSNASDGVFIGYQAGYSNVGGQNTYVGSLSGKNGANNAGGNTYVGHGTGTANTGGWSNTFVGLYAGTADLESKNTALGAYAMYSNTYGTYNLFAGYGSGQNNIAASDNTFLGFLAGNGNTYAERNVAIGSGSLYSQSFVGSPVNQVYDSANVAIGYQALYTNNPTANNNGIQNTAVGYQAGFSSTNGEGNTFMGYQSGYSLSNSAGLAGNNVAIGKSAFGSATIGYYNVAIGSEAMVAGNGNSNVAVGFRAEYSGGGAQNTAIGREALYENGLNSSTGSNNTAIGYSALYKNRVDENVAIGSNALISNSYSSRNVAIGSDALYKQDYANNGTPWETGNVAIGYRSLYNSNPTSDSNGNLNTSVGSYAGFNISTGSGDVFLGYKAGFNLTAVSNVLVIDNQDRGVGNEATKSLIYGTFSSTVTSQNLGINGNITMGTGDYGSGAAGLVLTIGRNSNATPGAGSINFLNKTGTAGYVWQDASGQLRINTAAPTSANDTAGTVIGTQSSTRATKQDIVPFTDYKSALQMITDAPLNNFRYKRDVLGYGDDSPLAKIRLGFIADEVPSLFMWDNTIDQVSVNGLLIASIKELKLENDQLKNMINANGTLGDGTVAGMSLDNPFVVKIKEVLAFLGIKFENGTTKIETVEIKKMQMVDQVTGDIYCTWISNGEWVKVRGQCSTIDTNPQTPSAPLINNTPPVTQTTSPSDGNLVVPPEPALDILGCMDKNATNYNPKATKDDGTCMAPVSDILGCTSPSAINYNSKVTKEDGSCNFLPIVPAPAIPPLDTTTPSE